MGTQSTRPNDGALVASVQAFIHHMARRYAPLVGGVDDLVAAGNMGALEAARRFDPTRGAQFLTYAGHWIRARILEEVRVLTGRRHGDAPVTVSLDLAADEDLPRPTPLVDVDAVMGEDEVASSEAAHLTWRFVESLDGRSQEVLRRRFLVDEPETLSEIAGDMQLSRERIRQIERAALGLLRKRLRRAGVDGSLLEVA